MSKIDELLKNEKVEWKKLGEVCEIITDYVAAGSFKTIAANVEYLKEPNFAQLIRTKDLKTKFINKNDFVYVNEKAFNFLYRVNLNKECLILPNIGNCGEVYYINENILAYKNNVLGPNAVLVRSEKNNNKFLYYLFSENCFQIALRKITTNTGQSKFNKTDLKEIEIPIPSLETQEKIVKILDKFTNYVTELQSELQSRTKQYNYYRDKLLSEQYLNKISDKLEGLEDKREISWNKISNICLRQKGINITAGEMKELNKIGALVRIFAGGNTIADVDEEDVGKDNVIKKDSIIVKSRGNIDFEFYDKPFSHKNELWSYSSLNKEILNIKFLYYYLKSNLQYFRDSAISGKLPQISIGNTDNYKVPLPHIDIQNKIVEILDKFQELLKDTKGLLPQEIEQRQKQYEYYREKLLTFDEKCGNTHTHNNF